MKNYSTKALFGATILSVVTLLSSCQKEELLDAPKDKNSTAKTVAYQQLPAIQAKDIARTVELQSIVLGALRLQPGYFKTNDDFDGCALITKDEVSVPHLATIDFGTGCTNVRTGKFYSGSITVEYTSEKMTVVGDKVHATFNSFRIDTITVHGILELEQTEAYAGTAHFDGVTSFKKSQLSLNGNHTYAVRFDKRDPDTDSDDVLSITGTGTGRTSDGLIFTNTISDSEPLYFLNSGSCKDPFLQGSLKIETQGMSDRIIDYGSGDCDNSATIFEDNVYTTIYFE